MWEAPFTLKDKGSGSIMKKDAAYLKSENKKEGFSWNIGSLEITM